jgi:hypothetical protein
MVRRRPNLLRKRADVLRDTRGAPVAVAVNSSDAIALLEPGARVVIDPQREQGRRRGSRSDESAGVAGEERTHLAPRRGRFPGQLLTARRVRLTTGGLCG